MHALKFTAEARCLSKIKENLHVHIHKPAQLNNFNRRKPLQTFYSLVGGIVVLLSSGVGSIVDATLIFRGEKSFYYPVYGPVK